MIPLSAPSKLYLFQLSTTSIPLPTGQMLQMSSGCYLIETAARQRLLIDSGTAPDAPLTPAPPSANQKNVLEHLAGLRLRPQDIDIVICTHFDVDHAGYHDSFPDAEFIVQREHYTVARNGHPRFAAARSHWDHPALHYRLVDGDTELASGLTLLETPGHAPGHQSVLLRLPQTGPVLLAIDAAVMQRTFTAVRKAWPTDDNEQQLRASTKKLLDLVEREKIKLVVFHHDGEQWKSLKKSPVYYD
ncbi:MAG TPA: N-acyl homoserine lactonase family protein [Candidatus Acidoferrum sp.]|nr:N-acyl homoserine lactonase family protein [Candidatus Acidoferrum sp.]